MKRVIIRIIIGMTTLALSFAITVGICSYFQAGKTDMGYTKLAYYANDVDTLIKDSNLVITGKVTNDQEEFKKDPQSPLTYVKSVVKVEEVIKGDKSLEGKTINLIQSKVSANPIVEKGGNKLLFLKNAINPIMENEYYIRGLFQGQYDIKNGKIKSVMPQNLSLAKSMEEIADISTLKAKVEKVK